MIKRIKRSFDADMYLLLKSKWMYIVGIILILYVTGNYILDQILIASFSNDANFKALIASAGSSFFASESIYTINSVVFSLIIFLFVFLFEFSNRKIATKITSGIKRGEVIFSKMCIFNLVVFTYTLIIFLWCIGLQYFGSGELTGIRINIGVYLFRTLLLQLIYGQTMYLFWTFFAILFKKMRYFLLFAILFAMNWVSVSAVMESIVKLIFRREFNFEPYIFLNYCSDFTSAELEIDRMLCGIIVCMLMGLGLYVADKYLFEKNEIF